VTALDELLDDLEEMLWAEDRIPLYQFSWCLRGLGRGLSENEIAGICQQAYGVIVRRHALHLEWFAWPAVNTTGLPAEAGTPLNFDINTTGEIESPFLVLVPDKS
jgi:hypothetical protein